MKVVLVCLLSVLAAWGVTTASRPHRPCPRGTECVPVAVCKGEKHRRPRPCGSKHDHRVCCPVGHREQHKMDYYDEGYSKVHGNLLSYAAKEILRDYRHRDECGVRHRSPADLARISTGYVHDKGITSYGEFPWHVALLVKQRLHKKHYWRPLTTFRYHCGATLIHPVLLLTAAHCVKGVKRRRLKAHLGEWNLFTTTGELFPAVERLISKVFIHSGYNPATYINDIALLQMDRPIDTSRTPHIAPACLPEDTYKFEDHKKCYIVGWGDDVYKPRFGSNVLKATSVTYSSDGEECADRLYDALPKVSDDYILDTDTQKCIIGTNGRDACVGDGGGAVVCPLDNTEGPDACYEKSCEEEHYFIAGVISFGSPYCGEDSITIITDIIKKINWIHTIISPAGGLKNYDYSYYTEGHNYKYRSANLSQPLQDHGNGTGEV